VLRNNIKRNDSRQNVNCPLEADKLSAGGGSALGGKNIKKNKFGFCTLQFSFCNVVFTKSVKATP